MNYMLYPLIGRPFEVDVFISSLSLAFDYHAEYHYRYVPLYLFLGQSLHANT